METLNVLVLESGHGAGADAIRLLKDAGHTVLRCHDEDANAFPCKGLLDNEECPLAHTSADVVVTVRQGPLLQPAPTEDGVSCALRHHVPLVVAGDLMMSPYEAYAVAMVETDDIVDAAQRAAAAPLPLHSRAATKALAEVAERRGISSIAPVLVHRHAGRLTATISAVDVPESERSMASVRIMSALRAIDAESIGIDITFV